MIFTFIAFKCNIWIHNLSKCRPHGNCDLLLQHYSFDLGGYTIKDLTRAWSSFKPEWVRQAVIESLFQGRYKAVSVNQILHLWERKGEPNCRYNHEFERLVCGDVAVIYEDRIFILLLVLLLVNLRLPKYLHLQA